LDISKCAWVLNARREQNDSNIILEGAAEKEIPSPSFLY